MISQYIIVMIWLDGIGVAITHTFPIQVHTFNQIKSFDKQVNSYMVQGKASMPSRKSMFYVSWGYFKPDMQIT